METDAGNMMIRTKDLRVDYGNFTAVKDMNLAIPPGEIYGLIGPNGAGKTTTIRVLATLLEPTYGDVYIDGLDIAEYPGKVHKILGYMPDFAPVYADLKVWEFLDLFAAAYFVQPSRRKSKIDEFIAMANLESHRNAKSGTLSRGMKQRLVLSKTLLADPKVLLLDEPASGLDPMARIELREMLKGLVKTGKTILISSHILTELSDFCTSIGIMSEGRMVVSGKIDDIVEQMTPQKTYIVSVLRREDRIEPLIKGFPKVLHVACNDREYKVKMDGAEEDSAALLAMLVKNDVSVKSFYEERMDVEDVFLKVGGDEVARKGKSDEKT